MRRAWGVVGLLVFGLLVGFAVRLIWPRSAPVVYARPTRDEGV